MYNNKSKAPVILHKKLHLNYTSHTILREFVRMWSVHKRKNDDIKHAHKKYAHNEIVGFFVWLSGKSENGEATPSGNTLKLFLFFVEAVF